jgi:hypothetical protein
MEACAALELSQRRQSAARSEVLRADAMAKGADDRKRGRVA